MSDPTSRLVDALKGRYEIERELGEGGMATVYLARDLKHNRQVGLKVLKPELAAAVGAERFLAEIETTAHLAHPHILPLHDSGEADGLLFYVMPYVEGESLREKIDRVRQLPVEEAVRIASDVAGALDYAHRHGVVHRDIKPANIMLQDGRALVADFGIALALDAAGSSRLTETGLSVGTPYYMSPEQATGDSAVGSATDIYALACVLYEMLVGEPPYPGATAQAVLGKKIAGGPVEVTALRSTVPPNVDAAIRKALEKVSADRFSSARDFAKALVDPGFRHGTPVAANSEAAGVWRTRALALAGLALVMTMAALWGWLSSGPQDPGSSLRISMKMQSGQEPRLGSILALSPNGSALVYAVSNVDDPSGWMLYLRQLGTLAATPIPGTEGAVDPVFSPSGREVAFKFGGETSSLRVTSLDGGAPWHVADSITYGATWSDDGESLYFHKVGSGSSALHRVSARGGAVTVVSTPDRARGHQHLAWPTRLPGDDRHLLVELPTAGADSVAVLDLETGEARTLVEGEAPRYSGSGHILYAVPGAQRSQLMALPFDLERLEATGDPILVLDNLISSGAFHSFAVSLTGRIVALTSPRGEVIDELVTPVWIDRAGAVEVIDPDWLFAPPFTRGIALSPDGTRVAVTLWNAEAGGAPADIWLKQLPRGPFNPVTREPVGDHRPKWSSDGRLILYVSGPGSSGGLVDVWRRRADGTGEPELLLDHDIDIWEVEVAPGGEWFAVRVGADGARDIMIRGPNDDRLRPVVNSSFDEKAIAISPDGRWLAYESDDTGRNEIYVRPFPNVADRRYAVSQQGGIMPKWAHLSNELFFVNGQREMTVARFTVDGDDFRVSELDALFPLPDNFVATANENYAVYDIAPDDQRFIWMQSTIDELPFDMILIDDWASELRARERR